MKNLLSSYQAWRRRTFPASKEDVGWRHLVIVAKLDELARHLATKDDIARLREMFEEGTRSSPHVIQSSFKSYPEPVTPKEEYCGLYPSVEPLTLEELHISNTKLFADRVTALESLPKGGIFAEIGVLRGDFSEKVFEIVKPVLFDAFDVFGAHNWPNIYGNPPEKYLDGKTQIDYFTNRFERHIGDGRLRIFEGDSSSCLAKQPDGFYDIIYIDGDHSLDGAWRDTFEAMKKLKKDGYLIFNDYLMYDYVAAQPYGVVQVVNFLCVKLGWKFEYIALQNGLYNDVCLRRRR